MAPLSLAAINRETFAIIPVSNGRKLVVKFTGSGDMDVTPVLNDFLKTLHADACRTGLREVVLDFSDLQFMNSSCFRCFVSWVGLLNNAPAEQRYEVVLVRSARVHWQRRSLEALQRFAPDVVVTQSVDR